MTDEYILPRICFNCIQCNVDQTKGRSAICELTGKQIRDKFADTCEHYDEDPMAWLDDPMTYTKGMKRCPFCGSTDVGLKVQFIKTLSGCGYCRNCGTEGPLIEGADGPIPLPRDVRREFKVKVRDAWNKRAMEYLNRCKENQTDERTHAPTGAGIGIEEETIAAVHRVGCKGNSAAIHPRDRGEPK